MRHNFETKAAVTLEEDSDYYYYYYYYHHHHHYKRLHLAATSTGKHVSVPHWKTSWSG
jgi:hypothetical protein